jgi:hypothetical protein
MKYESDLAPPEEPNAGRIALSIVLVIAIIAFLAWCAATMQAQAADSSGCDYSESLLTDALKEEPTRLVAHLEGQEMDRFFSAMSSKGWLSGTLYRIDGIYIVDAGKMKGFENTVDQVWIYFIQGGCILTKIGAIKSNVVELLP